MSYLTAAQWRERGFLIRFGARSHTRNRWGSALFSRDQVRRVDPRPIVKVVHVHHYH